MGAPADLDGFQAPRDEDKLSSSSSDAAQLEDVEDEGILVLPAQHQHSHLRQASFHVACFAHLLFHFPLFSCINIATLSMEGVLFSNSHALVGDKHSARLSQVHFSCMSFLCLKYSLRCLSELQFIWITSVFCSTKLRISMDSGLPVSNRVLSVPQNQSCGCTVAVH